MDVSTATFFANLIASILLVVWLGALITTRRVFRRPMREPTSMALDPEAAAPQLEELAVEAVSPDVLRVELVEQLTASRPAGQGGLEMHVEAGADGSLSIGGAADGVIHCERDGSRGTLVRFGVWRRPSIQPWIAGLLLFAGITAIVGGRVLIEFFVLPSTSPGVRAQAIQMVQAVHVVWPPYLVSGLAYARLRQVQRRVETAIRNAAARAKTERLRRES